MESVFNVTRKSRDLLLNFLNNYSLEQLNKIPEGYNNNLYWNVAHVVVSQQLLVYRLSGNEPMVTEEMINSYRKGTKPVRDVTADEVEEMKQLLYTTIDKTEKDYNSGLFINYTEYKSEFSFVMKSIDDAINFNNYHEGTHLGIMIAMRRFV